MSKESEIEENRVGEAVSKCLGSLDATNETVTNVLFNLLLAVVEDGGVTGAMSSEKVTLTISYNEDNDNG